MYNKVIKLQYNLTVKNEVTQNHYKIITPINASQLEKSLDWYDTTKQQFLINCFTFGFRIPYLNERKFVQSKNLKSAQDNVPILKQELQKEVNSGQIAGPFKSPSFKNLHIILLGLVLVSL